MKISQLASPVVHLVLLSPQWCEPTQQISANVLYKQAMGKCGHTEEHAGLPPPIIAY